MTFITTFIFLAFYALLASADLLARHNSSGLVSVVDGAFQLEGEFFRFYGTNAYWIQMTTDYDMELTFHDIATAGFKVVRTWAFNDVPCKPDSGPYFQILKDGTATINDGPDGLQRLDKVVEIAHKYGIKLVLSLTNNWNPERDMPSVAWNRRSNSPGFPRGYLSNDYGGMDLYVRSFKPGGTHDLFYTDPDIISAFKSYVSAVVSRYVGHPTILGWELGNDLRCSSTVAGSPNCNPSTITNWAADISSYIKNIDPLHLITPGDGGFYCLQCDKVYAKNYQKPSPALPGPSFDGSYGVDTEDLLAVPSIDFGSFQLFPDQVDYFPYQYKERATKLIGDGGRWIAVHEITARLSGKPEALLAAAIVTKDNWSSFVPFSSSTPLPDGTPCQGVEPFQQDFAFTAWNSVVANGNIGGFLEYQWRQNGLTSHGTTNSIWDKRQDLTESPQDGSGHYNGPANGQNAEQQAASLPAP
jgi:mannan endo-1,4-beta-mannosidase